MTKKEETFTLPGCSTWVLTNAGATGYYRTAFQPDAVRALASDAETKLTPAERITVENDIWASVRVGREPVGDYLAFAQGLQPDRNRAVVEDLLGGLHFIGEYLVSDSDRDEYRTWLRQYLAPAMKEVGYEPKPGESDEQRTLRSRLFDALGTMRAIQKLWKKRAKSRTKLWLIQRRSTLKWPEERSRWRRLNGDSAFYDRVMAATKNPKSPELYYTYLFTLPRFSDPKLLQRTLDFAISPDVRSQDALRVITSVMRNPAGRDLAWDFIRSALGCSCESWRSVCQRRSRGSDQRFLRYGNARSGDGILFRAQGCGSGAHL